MIYDSNQVDTRSIMPFCPDCRYEYKPSVSECPNCGAPLVDRLPEEEVHEKTQGDSLQNPNFVPLRNAPSRLYAEMLRGALDKYGIASMIKGDEGIAFRTTTTHIPVSKITVWVPQKDVERARQIADQILDHI
jgi:hypothetical protein